MEHKHLKSLKVLDGDKGEVQAVFATLNVIDKHGDVTRPGAFDPEDVLISAYGHESWFGDLPVGKGAIKEVGNEAVFTGAFFMDTTMGGDTFRTVKNTGPLQEWSYGFDILEAAMGQQDGQDVQFLDKLKVYEVSPVLLGAGENTRTLGTKSSDMKLEQHIKRVVTHVNELHDRASSVVTLRAEQGKRLGKDSAEALGDLDVAITKLSDLLAQVKADEHDEAAAEVGEQVLQAELARTALLLGG